MPSLHEASPTSTSIASGIFGADTCLGSTRCIESHIEGAKFTVMAAAAGDVPGSRLQADSGGNVPGAGTFGNEDCQSQTGGEGRQSSVPGGVPRVTWRRGGGGPPARQLLAKLRWATLGPAYDWNRREYSPAASSPVLPAYMRELAVRLAAAAGYALEAAGVGSCDASTYTNGLLVNRGPFEPNAALVNYYQSNGDTLCGHKVSVGPPHCLTTIQVPF